MPVFWSRFFKTDCGVVNSSLKEQKNNSILHIWKTCWEAVIVWGIPRMCLSWLTFDIKHHHNTTASWFDGRHPTTSSNITGLFNWLLLCAFTRLCPFAVFLTRQSKPIFSYHFDVIIPENLELIKNRISVKLVRQYRDNAARIKNFWSISVGNTATGPRFFRSVPTTRKVSRE